MTCDPRAPHVVHADDLFTLETCSDPELPGYLILRARGRVPSMGALGPDQAAAFGRLLARTVNAIEETTGADRVYVLTFSELDRNLHVHLFPRTAAILDTFRQAGFQGPIDGPRLFAWVRGEGRPAIDPSGCAAAAARIRSLLAAP